MADPIDTTQLFINGVALIQTATAGLQQQVTALNTTVQSQGSTINEQALALADLSSTSTGLVSDLALAESNINSVKGDIDTINLELDDQHTDFQNQINQLDSDKADTTYVDSATSSLNTAVSDVDARVTTLAGRVTTAEGNITSNTTAIATKASQSDLTTLTGRVTTAEGNITSNTTAIATKAAQSDLTTLTGRVTTAETNITTNATAVATKAAQSDLTALTTRVGTAEGNITSNTTALGNKADSSTLTSQIALCEKLANKDQANGYAGLTAGGVLANSTIPFPTLTSRGGVYGVTSSGGAANFILGAGVASSMNIGTQNCTGFGQGVFAVGIGASTWYDTAVGNKALNAYTTGNFNTAVGALAGATQTSGNGNLYLGRAADTSAGVSNGRIALGNQAIAKNDNEFAIAPAITRWRSEGLVAHTTQATPLAIDSGGVVRMALAPVYWQARPAVESNYVQGGGQPIFTNTLSAWTTTSGNSANLSGGITFNVPATHAGLWRATTYINRLLTGQVTRARVEIYNVTTSTVLQAFEAPITSSFEISCGGSIDVPLAAGNQVTIRLVVYGPNSTDAVIVRVNSVWTMEFVCPTTI